MIVLVALLLVFPALAYGQSQPAAVYVVAPKTSFVWGEPIKLTVVVRNSAGAQLSGQSIGWFVDPPIAGTVAADGTFTPMSLQTLTVSASAGNARGEVRLQVLPKKIVVVPERASMDVGSVQTIRAEALDINDRPIPGTHFIWRLQNLLGYWNEDQPLATIDLLGRLQSLAQGRLSVAATIPYSPLVPGFLAEAQGETIIAMRAKQTYTFERLLTSKPLGATSRVKARPAALLPTEDDGFVFAASLDSVTSALLEWKAGSLTPILLSGRTHSQSRQPLIEITSYARNHRGEMMTMEMDSTQTVQVSAGQAYSQLPLLVPGTPLYLAERTNWFEIQRNSLADSGFKLIHANYTDAAYQKSADGLFRGTGKGLEEAVVTTTDGLPGRAGQKFNWGKFGIAGDGTAWFVTIADDNQPVLWKQKPFGSIEKVIGYGDSFQGSEVTYVGPTGDWNLYPGLFVASNGEVVAGVNTRNRAYCVRWLPNNPQPEVLPDGTNGIYWHEPGVGSLINTNHNGQGQGLYLWAQGVTPLLRIGEPIEGSPVTEIYSAAVNSHGVVFAMAATTASPMVILRLQPDRQVVVRAGDEIPIQAPATVGTFVSGRRPGPPLSMVGGLIGTVAQITSDGGIHPLIAVGDPLPGGKVFRGSEVDSRGANIQVRSLPNGDVVFSDQNGVYRWRNGTIETVLQAPLRLNGVQTGAPSAFDMNSKGEMAAQIYAGAGTGVYRFVNGEGRPIVRIGDVVDGETVSDTWFPTIDEAGRIAFSFQSLHGRHIALWDGTSLKKLFSPGMTMPDGRQARDGGWILKGSADGFVTQINFQDGSTYGRYRNGAWEYVVSRTDRMPTGNSAGWVDYGNFDVNASGDVAFVYSGVGGQHLVVRRGNVFHEIHDFGTLTADEDFLLAMTSIHLNDDGTLYALATTDEGQQVIYRATPGAPANASVEFQTYSLNARGSASNSTAGLTKNLTTGFARIQTDNGQTTLAGLAIFGFRQNGVLVTEAAVPATTLTRGGRFYVEVGDAVNTGLAIANPGNQVAVVQFYATDLNGARNSGSVTVGANSQISQFLDTAPFNVGRIQGTFTFTSSVPVGVTALRGFTNELGNFLVTTLPIADTAAPVSGDQYLPHFALGGGWSTQLILVNPTDTPLEGTFVFNSPGSVSSPGAPLTVTIARQSSNSFAYSIPPRTAARYVPAATGESTLSGYVLIAPGRGTAAPSALAVFAFRTNRVTVSEAGVSGSAVGRAFRTYVESRGKFATAETGSIATGLAIANTSPTPATVTVDLINADGSPSGLRGTLRIPASGQVSTFVDQIAGFERMESPFSGTLLLTSDNLVSVMGLRGRYNEASNFLVTTLPVIPDGPTGTAERIFPHFADGEGYSTQFILINSGPNPSAGAIKFFNRQGQPLPLRMLN
ncbi:MAG TPA: hypothetical protein VE422_12160 [Terriglobia bacterium]|nr:hypothetical protein [Terriglobia bacterium]